MKNIVKICLLILFPLFVFSIDYDSYDKIKIKYMVGKHKRDFSNEKTENYIQETGGHRLRTRAIYCGEQRDITALHKKFCEYSFKSIERDDLIGFFDKEVKIQENGKTYWVCINKQLLKCLVDEVKANENAAFYLTYLGQVGSETIKEGDHVFVINDFVYSSEYNEKLMKTSKALEKYSKDDKALEERAKLFFKEGMFDESLEDYSNLEKLNVQDNTYLFNYGVAYYERGLARSDTEDFKSAIKEFDKAIEINNSQAMYYNARAYANWNINETEKAKSDFEKCIIFNPENKADYQANIDKLNIK